MNEKPSAPAAPPPTAPAAAPIPAPSLPPPAAPPKSQSAANYTKPVYVWPACIILAVLLYLGIVYVCDVLTHESTDDAFIAGHIISIAPRVAGQVSAVHVNDNQFVHANDLLIEIDPADYSTTVAQKQAAAISQDANFRAIVAGYQLMQTKVKTAEATLRQAQADADATGATATNALTNLNRAQSLITDKTISQQEFDTTQAANLSAQANWQSKLETVAEDASKVDEANKQLAAAYAEKDVAFANVSQAQTNVAAAQLDLSYTRIYAPADGLVTRKAVEAGDYLQTGQQIMSIVPTEVWVVANFKESQLVDMHPGQPVEISIDAIGGKKFKGKVDSIQAGSGAQFSLLPPENATGNFVKVVQRVPVKILFTDTLPSDYTIGPGLSVTPEVQVKTWTLPPWAAVVIAIILAIIAGWAFLTFTGNKEDKA